MSSVNQRNSKEEERLELMDKIVDLNMEYKINILTKLFFDNVIIDVIDKTRERMSLLKRNPNRFSVSYLTPQKKQEKEFKPTIDMTNKCSKDSKAFFSKILSDVSKKIKNEKKNQTAFDSFYSFEFGKFNKENIINSTSKKFIDISIKNSLILMDLLNKKKKEIGENILKENYELNSNENFKFANSFLNEIYKRVLDNLFNNNIRNKKYSEGSKEIIRELEFEHNDQFEGSKIDHICNQISKEFLNDKIRKTIKLIDSQNTTVDGESISNELVKSEKSDSEKIEMEHEKIDILQNLRVNASKSFMIDSINNITKKVDAEEVKTIQEKFREEKKSLMSTTQFFDDAVKKITENECKIKPKNNQDNQNNKTFRESLKKISSIINEKVFEKEEMKKEEDRKSKRFAQKVLDEKYEVEKEKLMVQNKNDTNLFWNSLSNNTMDKYQIYNEKLLKYTLRIQRNFRGHLLRFIFKIEKMNREIERQNQLAKEATKRKRSSTFSKK